MQATYDKASPVITCPAASRLRRGNPTLVSTGVASIFMGVSNSARVGVARGDKAAMAAAGARGKTSVT